MKTLLASTAAALLVAGTAMAANQDDVGKSAGANYGNDLMALDANGNGYIEPDEWAAIDVTTQPAFVIWDTDKNGTLSPEEFNSGVMSMMDADNDGMVSQSEAGVWADYMIRSGAEVSH